MLTNENDPNHYEVERMHKGVEICQVNDLENKCTKNDINKIKIKDLSMNEYTKNALSTWDGDEKLIRAFLGLSGESGEVMEAMKKFKRGDYDEAEFKKRCKKELGDVLYYLSMCANEIGFSLSEVGITNNEKLKKRKLYGRIKGDGDER